MLSTAQEVPPSRVAGENACIQVLIVGQSRLFADALGMALANDPGLHILHTLQARCLDLECIGTLDPDVLLVESGACAADLVPLISSLQAACPRAKIVLLAGALSEPAKAAGIRAGALGYISGEHSVGEAAEAIRSVGNGGVLVSADELCTLLRQPPAPPMPLLRPREIDVLRVLAMGFSAEEAAARLEISPHTVRTHLKLALRKLGARSKVEGIIVALRRGLIELPT